MQSPMGVKSKHWTCVCQPMYIRAPEKALSKASAEQQHYGTQMQAASAAAATKEAALNEEKTALEARLQDTTSACTALETKVSSILDVCICSELAVRGFSEAPR